MQYGNLAEWSGAVATFLAVVVAFVVAFRDGILRKRSEKQQQAKLISAWPVHFGLRGNKDLVYISNASLQPIYDVFISYGVAYGAGESYFKGATEQTGILRVPPGEYFAKAPKNQGGGMHIQLGISISFRDINGLYWRRDAQGKLSQTNADPFVTLNVDQPFGDWQSIDPVTPIKKPLA